MPVQPDQILEQLVAIPSVVGRPNGAIIDHVAGIFREQGIEPQVLPGPEGDRANLFATVGPRDVPGYVISGHLDVVPAQEPGWQGDPFTLRRDGERLIGRGACDMKGFVAAALSCLPDLVAMPLGRPVHFALSYDEEAGARGAPHMIARLPELCAPPLGCVVGEPSNMVPVLRHKGKEALRISAAGISGHSSRTDLGRNAIHMLAPVLSRAVELAAQLETGPCDAHFAPPWSTLQVGVIRGGDAINIIPGEATLEIEARAIAGVDPSAILEPLRDLARAGGLQVERLSSYPPLALDESAPFARDIAALTGTRPLAAVSYGTEAGLFSAAGLPALICGPGDISRAHKPEEYITLSELDAARQMLLRLARTHAAQPEATA